VQCGAGEPEIAAWENHGDWEWWKCMHPGHAGTSRWMGYLGYRYVAPIPMLETT
jgi:hypothetical protein